MIRVSELKLPLDGTKEQLKKKAARALGVAPKEIKELKIFRRSLDARKKDDIHYVYTADVLLEDESRIRVDGKKLAPAPDIAYRLRGHAGKTPCCRGLWSGRNVCRFASGGNGTAPHCAGTRRRREEPQEGGRAVLGNGKTGYGE